MHLTRTIGIALLAVILSGLNIGDSTAVGQEKGERLFGNGRFLRRVFGQPESEKKKKPAASKSTKKGKQPTLAATPKPKSAKLPKPTPSRTSPAPRLNAGNANSYSPRLKQQPGIGSTRSGERVPASVTRSTRVPTLGFGMLVEAKKDALVVTKLDPKGNAKEAGVKTGDVIIRGGGVDFQSVEEFNQIAEVLKDGDQLEFELKRRGKEEKLLISFGEAVDETDRPSAAKEQARKTPARDIATGPNSVNTKDNYSFLPTNRERRDRNAFTPTPSSNLKSVLGGGEASPELGVVKPAADRNQWRSSGAIQKEDYKNQLERQQREIERLRRELERKNENSVIEIPELGGPSLSGPGGK